MSRFIATFLTLWSITATGVAADLDWIAISADGKGFVQTPSQRRFVPWGFNYDHDHGGQLLEDYWHQNWDSVISAFDEMRSLGANVVRIHLQFGKFMESPTQPRQKELDRLRELIALAERTGLYLDVTGLGCYHKADVPAWYDQLGEAERWSAQAAFWEAIAKVCAPSPAIFCYDLMNEPVVAGGNVARTDWLGPGFGGKHFVQYVTLDRADRDRADVAHQWVSTLVAAIRKHDQRHLITVGLVPWSLDRPGLTSGFVPGKIAGELDFIAVHLYPEQHKLDEALATLQGFAAAGKPVVIEEIFPLKCSVEELSRFIDLSRPHASGWIGFYWGKSPEQLKTEDSLPAAITLGWLELFQQKTPDILRPASDAASPRKPAP